MYITEDDLEHVSDDRLISELESRGFILYDEDEHTDHKYENLLESLEDLYLDYMLSSHKFFDAQLRKFFNDCLQKTLK